MAHEEISKLEQTLYERELIFFLEDANEKIEAIQNVSRGFSSNLKTQEELKKTFASFIEKPGRTIGEEDLTENIKKTIAENAVDRFIAYNLKAYRAQMKSTDE